jgi:hypothetical protein
MKTMNKAHQARKAVQSTRRSVLAAAAITTLFASSSAVTWAAAVEPLSQVGASLPVAQFDNGAMPAANTWSRASGFASVLVGEELRTLHSKVRVPAAQAQFRVESRNGVHYLVEAAREQRVASTGTGASDAEMAAQVRAATASADKAGRISVLVDNERRDLLAVNGAVADDFSSGADVGAGRARAIFDSALQSLSSNHLIEQDVLALGALRTHRLMQGERARGGPVVSRVKEYLFEVPHAVGGIEVFGASTTVAVHRSGELVSIRTTGPVATEADDRSMVTRTVSAEALAERARSEHPNAKVVSLGLRYPWQATGNAALAARPRQAFQVIPLAQVAGREVKGRAHFVFYSVEGEQVAPLVWPKANPNATGDVRE